MIRPSQTLLLALALIVATTAAEPQGLNGMESAFARGDFAASYAAATARLAHDPNDIDANLTAALIALYRNDLDAAARYDGHVTDLKPEDTRGQKLADEIAERRADTTDVAASALPARIAFAAADPIPLIPVQVNGHQGFFLINTDADATTLDPAFANEAGVKITAAGTGTFPNGEVAFEPHGIASTLQVGAVTMHDVQVVARGTRELAFFPDHHPDGELGTRFFTHFLTTIDYPNQVLVLRPRSDSAAFERDAKANAVPMLLAGDHSIIVRGKFDDGPDGWINVDTGLGPTGLSPTKTAVSDSHIILDEEHTQPGANGQPLRFARLAATVTIGIRSITNVQGYYLPDDDWSRLFPFAVRGAVSHLYFAKCALTFDFVAMRMVMI
ncbi:MAG TPA: aspartyl protease family protein [Candidatus Sulfotelmatobacter sp.]|nr:aspartyl protease family protein [Candidatus Sulfotelmatobacter sp.]